MSSSSAPSGGTPPAVPPAAPPAPPPPVPPATPKKQWFKVTVAHDWAKFEAESPGEAEAKFRKHFGITGSDNRLETQGCDPVPKDGVWHSGQQQTR